MNKFPVKLTHEPGGTKMGTWKCTTSLDGLTLTHKTKEPMHIPIGSTVKMTRPEKFNVLVDGVELGIQVNRMLVYQNRLARDLAGFIKGDRLPPKDGDYNIELYFLALAVLPAGIPWLTIGGALPTFFAWGLFIACFFVFQNENRPKWFRLLCCAAIVGAGYALVIGLLFGLAHPVPAPSTESRRDTDDDGLDDNWEREHFSFLDQAQGDDHNDEDGVPEWEEYKHGTHPYSTDSDDDLIPDRAEIDATELDPNHNDLVMRLDFELSSVNHTFSSRTNLSTTKASG